MKKNIHQPFPWRLFLSELIGTALLLLVGLSIVILMFGTGSPMPQLIPNEKLRQVITGFLFGSTGAAIALSAIGKESGAHKSRRNEGILVVSEN
jgi:aquaporin Z